MHRRTTTAGSRTPSSRSNTITSRFTASSAKEAGLGSSHGGLARGTSMRTWSSRARSSSTKPGTYVPNTTPILWQGWLSKTGSKDSNFHKRYFKLHANGNFDYYDKEDSLEPKGTCDLKVTTVDHQRSTGIFSVNC